MAQLASPHQWSLLFHIHTVHINPPVEMWRLPSAVCPVSCASLQWRSRRTRQWASSPCRGRDRGSMIIWTASFTNHPIQTIPFLLISNSDLEIFSVTKDSWGGTVGTACLLLSEVPWRAGRAVQDSHRDDRCHHQLQKWLSLTGSYWYKSLFFQARTVGFWVTNR